MKTCEYKKCKKEPMQFFIDWAKANKSPPVYICNEHGYELLHRVFWDMEYKKEKKNES